MDQAIKCYQCSHELIVESGQHIPRNEECPKCYANIHSCMMCSFYERSAYNECREPMATRVLEKEKANFCEFFKISAKGNQEAQQEDLLSKASALFKD